MKKQFKVLVIDDDTCMLQIIHMVLSNAGYQVSVENDAKLLFLTQDKYPDIILLDNNLGVKTGSEICKELKNLEAVKHIPIILISAIEGLEAIAREARADDYLMKPFTMKPLVLKLENLLQQSA